MKQQLVRAIQSVSMQNEETIDFTSPLFILYQNNPDMVCSIYGISKGILLFDSINISLDMVDMNLLPIESLVAIKSNMENNAKSKLYSR